MKAPLRKITEDSIDNELPFLQHFAELRKSLIFIALGIISSSIIGYYYSKPIFELITSPLYGFFSKVELIGTSPTEAFMVKLKVAILFGILISIPFTFFHVWKFISPGLRHNERNFLVPFVFFSSAFFLTGVSFCFYFVLPYAFLFFSEEFASIGINPNIRVGEYLSFIVTLLIVFGTIFELPIVCYFLARLRLITSQWLIKKIRYSIVIIFIVAGVLTPPDPITQSLLAVPLTVIYLGCIGICYFVEGKRK